MVLYFTGTGNSRFVAKIISEVAKDELVSMNERIKNHDNGTLASEAPFVFVAPTYAWRMPKVVADFISATPFEGSKKAYFVLTCGDSAGNAAKYCEKLSRSKGFAFMGLAPIVMPENYIVMFQAPEKAKAAAIIEKAKPSIYIAAEHIRNERSLPEIKSSPFGVLGSAFANLMFASMPNSARDFYSTEKCTGCGKCAELCPVNNVLMEGGRPKWGRVCVNCMACICGCPTGAIEYKEKTKGRRRYYLEG